MVLLLRILIELLVVVVLLRILMELLVVATEAKQLGDLTLALDELSKEFVCKLTGKTSYELGDLSIVIDTRCALGLWR